MLTKRLQILLTPEQHRALGERAKADGTSIGQVVREAIDEKLEVSDRERKRRAFEEIKAMRLDGPVPSIEELRRWRNEETDREYEEFHGRGRSKDGESP